MFVVASENCLVVNHTNHSVFVRFSQRHLNFVNFIYVEFCALEPDVCNAFSHFSEEWSVFCEEPTAIWAFLGFFFFFYRQENKINKIALKRFHHISSFMDVDIQHKPQISVAVEHNLLVEHTHTHTLGVIHESMEIRRLEGLGMTLWWERPL